jgi:uncharacterized membrane protein YeaQ/YmgE (transglycosylase-associated protein family)
MRNLAITVVAEAQMNFSYLGNDWLAIIVFGFLAGIIARALMPGKHKIGCVMTVLLGIAGGVSAAWLVSQFELSVTHRWLRFAAAIAGSMLLLWIGAQLKKK